MLLTQLKIHKNALPLVGFVFYTIRQQGLANIDHYAASTFFPISAVHIIACDSQLGVRKRTIDPYFFDAKNIESLYPFQNLMNFPLRLLM